MLDWPLLLLYLLVLLGIGAATLRWCTVHQRNPLLPLAVILGLIIAPWFLFDVFIEPPRDVQSEHGDIALIVALVLLPIFWALGAIYTWRTRSPLFFWTAISGIFLYPLIHEPVADLFVAAWWPDNQPIVATVFDRPIPWTTLVLFAAGIPLFSVISYEIAKRYPPKRLLAFAAFVAAFEVPVELIFGHFNILTYYGNHAVVLREPIFCFVQNGGFMIVIAWCLAHMTPIRGWRWPLVPIVVMLALWGYSLTTTFPAFLTIHYHATPLVGWTAGIIAVVLNLAVAIACAYSPVVARLRANHEQTPASSEPKHTMQPS